MAQDIEELDGPRSIEAEEALLIIVLGANMRYKLAQNRHKLHWRDSKVSVKYLLDRAVDELIELVEAVLDDSGAGDVWGEAADVANMVAMAAELYELGPFEDD